MRKADNDAEKALWSELKGRQLNGAKFTRQLPVGPYFADFACRESRLVIELDGSQHFESEYDRKRDRSMVEQGWSVLRFWNIDALVERDAVVDTILAALERRLEPVEATDLRFVAAPDYLRRLVGAVAAPHPYPLPVKDGERGTSPSVQTKRARASATLTPPSPRPSRGEGKGEGYLLPVNGEKEGAS